MKRRELELLSELLGMASDEFSNHGCNDFAVPNTPENNRFMTAAEIWNQSNPESREPLNVSKDGTEIYTQDWFLMDYLKHLVDEEAKQCPASE